MAIRFHTNGEDELAEGLGLSRISEGVDRRSHDAHRVKAFVDVRANIEPSEPDGMTVDRARLTDSGPAFSYRPFGA